MYVPSASNFRHNSIDSIPDANHLAFSMQIRGKADEVRQRNRPNKTRAKPTPPPPLSDRFLLLSVSGDAASSPDASNALHISDDIIAEVTALSIIY